MKKIVYFIMLMSFSLMFMTSCETEEDLRRADPNYSQIEYPEKYLEEGAGDSIRNILYGTSSDSASRPVYFMAVAVKSSIKIRIKFTAIHCDYMITKRGNNFTVSEIESNGNTVKILDNTINVLSAATITFALETREYLIEYYEGQESIDSDVPTFSKTFKWIN